MYYDYIGACSNQGGICTTANACEIKAEKCDVCPQSSQDVVCCKKCNNKLLLPYLGHSKWTKELKSATEK